jgi:hypothetical protein
MYPCETLQINFSFSESSPGQDRWAFADLKSSNGPGNPTDYTVHSYGWRIDGSGGESVPRAAESSPFHGALGEYVGVIKKITLSTDTPADPMDTSPVQYTVTFTFVKRAGYNDGDTTIANAGGPVYDNSVIKLGMAGAQPQVWNYYKISVPPQGTVSLTGTLENRHGTFDANLIGQLQNASGNAVAQFFNKTVSAASTDSLPNPPTTYTNTSGQTVDYYLAFSSSQSARLYSAQVTVHCTVNQQACAGPPPPPVLRLLLDEDGDISHLSPPPGGGDAATFLPGSKHGQESVPVDWIRSPSSTVCSPPAPPASPVCSATLYLIAFFVDPVTGQWVPPPANAKVTFALNGTSAWKGFAMNATWNDPVKDDGPDFMLVPLTGSTWGAESLVLTDVDFAGGPVAKVGLRVKDYGGRTTVTATPTIGQAAPALQLPLDSTDNYLPDVGWIAPFVSGTTIVNTQVSDNGGTWIDDEYGVTTEKGTPLPVGTTPPATGQSGDGFTRFEEYRGFVVLGSHRRTSPAHKDLFVSTSVFLGSSLSRTQSLEFSTSSFFLHGIRLHRVFDPNENAPTPEWGPAQNVNYAYQYAGTAPTMPGFAYNPQAALRVQEAPLPVTPLPGGGTSYTLGETTAAVGCGTDQGYNPNKLPTIKVSLQNHQSVYGNSGSTVENELRRTSGHEIGHAVHVKHKPANSKITLQPQCDDGATSSQTSMMTYGNSNGQGANNALSRYHDEDIVQVRVRVP